MNEKKEIINEIRKELEGYCLVDVADLTMLFNKFPFPVALPTKTSKRINDLLIELEKQV